jgi:thioredoxin 1
MADSANLVTLTKDNFDSEIESGVTLVDFWAPWCGPCRMIAPVIEELADEWKGKAKIGKLNTDEHGEVAMNYGIQGIPTLILFKDGKPVDRVVGALPKAQFTQLLEKHTAE